jgi:hypothetical protein
LLAAIIKAAKICSSVTDIAEYAKIAGVLDIAEFVDLVIFARYTMSPSFVVKNAKN